MALDGIDPLYQQIAAILIDRINAGTYPPKSQIPSPRELAEEFEVDRNTAVKAVGILQERGLVRGVVGRGTFVLPPAEEEPPEG
jgi:DNA-binding GntR family transcriptional regulator